MLVEEELLADLETLISSEEIDVEDSTSYFENLELNYPIGGSQIDWSRVPGSERREVSSISCFVPESCAFFWEIVENHNLNGKCVFVNDGAIDASFAMDLVVLKKCLRRILEVPQHIYIISEASSWCFAFTMDGWMSFGFSPKIAADSEVS